MHGNLIRGFILFLSFVWLMGTGDGDRAFSVVAPKLWNHLPPELRDVTCVDQFRTHLKINLFKLAYDVSF